MEPIYNFAKPAFNEVIPAPKSPINNAGSTPCGGLPRLVRPPFDRLDYCYRWFLLRFNMFMRSTTRFRAVIPRFCSRFFSSIRPWFYRCIPRWQLLFFSYFSFIFIYILQLCSIIYTAVFPPFSLFFFSLPFSFYFSGFYMARRVFDLYMGWFARTKRTMDTVDLGAARMEMRQA